MDQSRSEKSLGLVTKKNNEIIENKSENSVLNKGNINFPMYSSKRDFYLDGLGKLGGWQYGCFHNLHINYFLDLAYYDRLRDYLIEKYGQDLIRLDYITIDLRNDEHLLIIFRYEINDVINKSRNVFALFDDFIEVGLIEFFGTGIIEGEFFKFLSRTEIREYECAYKLIKDIKEVPIWIPIWKEGNREPFKLGNIGYKNFQLHIDHSHGYPEYELKYYNRERIIGIFSIMDRLNNLLELINPMRWLPTIDDFKEQNRRDRELRVKGFIPIRHFSIEANKSVICEPIEYNYGHLINDSLNYNDISYNKINYENYG